ncbi:putative myosin-10-like isoform X2 [Capsicum annuum]|nr:putative myosin-10-like isoform X2 [Capsicum annuum]
MGILEKISEALHNNEENTVELRRKMLKLILECGDVGKGLKLSNNCLKECVSEMESKGLKELELKWKELSVARKGFAETVKLREEKLNDQEKMVERLWEEVEFERKQIGDLEEKLIGLNVKEKELNKLQTWIRHETQAREVKEQELDKKMEEFERMKEFEVNGMGLESVKKELKVNQNNLDHVKKELKEKEGNLESVKKGVSFQEGKLDNVKKELTVNQNNLDHVEKELKEKESNLASVKKGVSFQEGKLDGMKKELWVLQNSLDDVKKELKENKNICESVKEELKTKESKLGALKEEIGEKENNLEAVNKELGVKENRLSGVKKVLTVKGSRLYSLEEELREKEKKLDYVKKDLNENQNKLESVKKDLADEESKLDSVKKVVGVNESTLEILKSKVIEKENNLEAVNKALVVEENRLAGVKQVLTVKESKLGYLDKELREKEKTMDFVKKELREKESNLDFMGKELIEKEKQLDYVNKELRQAETNLDFMKKELTVKENILDSMNKEVTLKGSNLEVVTKELKEMVRDLDFVKTELREKENELKSVRNEVKAEADNLNALRKQVESDEEILSSKMKELEHKEKFLGAMKKKIELQEEHLKSLSERLHLRERELDSTQEAYMQRIEELNSKEKKLDLAEELMKKSHEEFQSEKRQYLVEQGLFEQRMKNVILGEERIKDRLEELESREKLFENWCKELGEKEKQLNAFPNALIKTEPSEDVGVDRATTIVGPSEDVGVDRVTSIVGDSAVTRFVVIVDGKSLQIFLNEHEKELDLMSDGIFEALQMSPDPAKLVLDAMEGFYPPHLRKGETEFEGSVTRQSCILLLEQLIRVSPEIQGSAREVARDTASDWKVKMKATKGNQDEILGFLYLLAAYNLVSSFDADELFILLEIVAKHDKFSELCRARGMKQNLPSFVQNLLTKQQHLEAIRYAYAFELAGHFQPIAILKDYLESVERNYVDVFEKETCSAKEKIEAIELRVASVRAVIKFILDYNLQSQYPVKQFEEQIELLTRQKEDQAALALISEAKRTEPANVNQMGSTNPSIHRGFSAKACACTLGLSNAMAIILMNMSGKNLQKFLNKHLKEHKLLRSEVFSALRMSLDSDMLVLEALEGFYPPDHQKEEIGFHRDIIRQSCILLLEQFMELPPEIKPEAKLEASKLALAWKAKMISGKEDQLAILGFLLFVGCYRLASAFGKDELGSLYHKVAHRVNTSKICHALDISDNTSRSDDFRSIEKSKRHQAQGCTDESICNNMTMESEGHNVICNCASSLCCTSDIALLVLDVFRSFHPTKIVRCENFPLVMRSFSDLLDQLGAVSPEIERHVKEEASEFAFDWYSTLIGSQLTPIEVVAFLQLLAIYEIADSFHSDKLLGLLEKVQPTERVVTWVKILGLTDEIQCFVRNLRNKKKWLVAFTYVYAFELGDKVSPVSLLKDYVSHSKQIAKQILHAGNSSYEAQAKAIKYEIHVLRNAIRHIVYHGLQSEYSPSCLERQIERLEYQVSSLRRSNSKWDFTAKFQRGKTNKGTCGSSPIAQVRKGFTKKRSAPSGNTDVIHRAQQKQYFKRHCHLSI